MDLLSSTISNAVNGLVLYPHLLTKMYFPREIIPLSYVLAALTDFCIASVILMGVMTYYKVPLTLHLLYTSPSLLCSEELPPQSHCFCPPFKSGFETWASRCRFAPDMDVYSTCCLLVAVGAGALPRHLFVGSNCRLIENFRQVVVHGADPNRVVWLFVRG